MPIGILKEIKAEENRVCMSPGGVEFMRQHGHQVLVEKNAGRASGFGNALYKEAGAEIVESSRDIFKRAKMIMRVKEPQPFEFELMREDQIYFAYLHLAASKEVTLGFIKSGSVAVAYETIQKADGTLPLLTPMSEVAGPMAIQQGAKYLEMAQGGHGVLLGGVPGVDPATVVIIGGGVVGINAAKMACGLGAKVTILDIDLERLRYLSDVMPGHCITLMYSPAAIRDLLPAADVVVGAVLVTGSKTPTLITREMLKLMKKGSVIVDVAIDQGGCIETAKPTTHDDPIYEVDGIIHYCVANMPGAVSMTSTLALTNATLPYALELADKGYQKAAQENPELAKGINVIAGKITYAGVADAFSLENTSLESVIN